MPLPLRMDAGGDGGDGGGGAPNGPNATATSATREKLSFARPPPGDDAQGFFSFPDGALSANRTASAEDSVEDAVERADEKEKQTALRTALETAAIAVTMGAVFGVVMERSGVANPATIRAQLVFAQQHMLKMFLAAVGASALVAASLERAWPDEFHRARRARVGEKGLRTMAVGGLAQGAGMALSGACPGMVMVCVGKGVPGAAATALGGVAGALVYGWQHPALRDHHAADFQSTIGRLPSGNLDEAVRARRFAHVAVPLGVACLAAAVAVDLLVPFRGEAALIPGVRTPSDGLLSPVVAGVAVGALQLPAFALLETFLGTSSAYSVVASLYMRAASERHKARFAYAASWLTSRAWWQVAYVLGALLGGLASARGWFGMLPSRAAPSPPGVGVAPALLGGFLIVWGARVAGGCASGHGVSGLSLLSVAGWVVVPAMFAGGVLVALAMQAAWGREEFLLVSRGG